MHLNLSTLETLFISTTYIRRGKMIDRRWLNKNWLLLSLIGVAMMVIGLISRAYFAPDTPLIIFPLTLFGLGLLMAFVSVASFRGKWGKGIE